MVKVVIEFGGGLDILFGHNKTIEADIPSTAGQEVTITPLRCL